MERWKPYLSVYKAWFEVLEQDDSSGQYSPVHTFSKPPLQAGGVLRLRLGSPRRLRLTLQHMSGAALNIASVFNVTVSELDTIRAGEASNLDSYREADLELVKERFQQLMQESKMQRDDTVRELMDKEQAQGKLTAPEQQLIDKLRREGEQMLFERNALYETTLESGLPGLTGRVGLSLPGAEFFEQRPYVAYVPIGARAVGDLPALAQDHWEVSEDTVELRIISQEIDSEAGLVDAVCAWDAAAHTNPALSRITPDGMLWACRVRITLKIDLADSSLVINKILCGRVTKRTANLNPSVWERINGVSRLPGGAGIMLQVITGLPTADESGVSDESQVADFDRRLRDARKLASIDRLEQIRAIEHQTLAMARRSTMAAGSVASSNYPRIGGGSNANAAELAALEAEIYQLQHRLEQAEALRDSMLVNTLQDRLHEKLTQLATLGGRSVSFP